MGASFRDWNSVSKNMMLTFTGATKDIERYHKQDEDSMSAIKFMIEKELYNNSLKISVSIFNEYEHKKINLG